ncbi:Factor of DNA methylation 1 [Forsythia ovata]|uniref:Factor of DNA methylation 1 n=1 Tax=Forsythia ovata TaxID=205694 RepID=A0ABD1P3G4_9LAMI
MNEQLEEKIEEMDGLEDINKQLLTKELLSNDELQKARKELITGLNEMLNSSRVNIGIKRMGEIDEKAFQNIVKHKFPPEEAEIKTIELCSLWQEKLKNPDFYPFKIIHNDGKHEEVLYKDDESQYKLKDEWEG